MPFWPTSCGHGTGRNAAEQRTQCMRLAAGGAETPSSTGEVAENGEIFAMPDVDGG
jgi:hypothetical protein